MSPAASVRSHHAAVMHSNGKCARSKVEIGERAAAEKTKERKKERFWEEILEEESSLSQADFFFLLSLFSAPRKISPVPESICLVLLARLLGFLNGLAVSLEQNGE
jgi:hypothetical protein